LRIRFAVVTIGTEIKITIEDPDELPARDPDPSRTPLILIDPIISPAREPVPFMVPETVPIPMD
jgi:hypothetical protein